MSGEQTENVLAWVDRHPENRYCEGRLGSLVERYGEEEADRILAGEGSDPSPYIGSIAADEVSGEELYDPQPYTVRYLYLSNPPSVR